MKTCKHFAIISMASVKKGQKSAYDCECHVISKILTEHRQQDHVQQSKRFF